MNEVPPADSLLPEVEALTGRLARARAAIGRVIFGQEAVVERTLVTLLSGGHLLLVGVPGLGKTKLVEALGTVMGLDARRVQFTPDLMPADILGSEVLEEDAHGRREFRFIQGPVFTQLLMADEINRASPRTQSALLQAMQEHKVAVGGRILPLPAPSTCWPPRIPSSRKAPTRCPRRSWTASCWKWRWTTPTRPPSAPCCWQPPAPPRRGPRRR